MNRRISQFFRNFFRNCGIFATSRRPCPIFNSKLILSSKQNIDPNRFFFFFFFFFFLFFFFFTEASLADKYLLAEKRREEGDRGESGRSDGRSCWNRWNVYDGALNRSIKRTWRARNARKPGAWLEQKKRLEWSSPWSARTIVTYILISTGVRLRTCTRKGVRYTRGVLPVPRILAAI